MFSSWGEHSKLGLSCWQELTRQVLVIVEDPSDLLITQSEPLAQGANGDPRVKVELLHFANGLRPLLQKLGHPGLVKEEAPLSERSISIRPSIRLLLICKLLGSGSELLEASLDQLLVQGFSGLSPTTLEQVGAVHLVGPLGQVVDFILGHQALDLLSIVWHTENSFRIPPFRFIVAKCELEVDLVLVVEHQAGFHELDLYV